MATFYRAVWPEEEPVIRDTGVIPANHKRWKGCDGVYYEAGTVVFLFSAEKTWPSLIESFPKDLKEKYGATRLIKFDMEAEVEMDKSGWGLWGSVVHKGPIPLASVKNFEWLDI